MDRRRRHHRGDGNGNVELASGDGAWQNPTPPATPRIALYVDQRLVSGDVKANWQLNGRTGTRFVVGNLGVNMVYAAKADIDEVRIYNPALTAGEVASLYNTFLNKGIAPNATANTNAGCPAPVMPSGG